MQNFVSAATGMAVLVALVRGFARKEAKGIGNFWVDLTRTTVYILLPLSVIFTVVLVSQGVPQTFNKYATATLVQPVTYDNPKNGPDGQPLKDDKGNPVTEKATATEQTIPLGPAASQIAIKQLGTNGGGFFNVNSAHPFENPTPLSNFLEMLAILLIPAALCYTFGKMIRDTRQGWALLAAMTLVFVPLLAADYALEAPGNPVLADARRRPGRRAPRIPAATWKARKLRLGVANSTLWAVATTSASNGSVNSMHDSFMPLAGMIPMWLIQLGEVIYGGVGSGLYGMIMFALIAVFIAGLMIGRTPEYLGKKIGAFEIKMASIAILLPPLLVLCGTAIAVMVDAGKAGVANPAEHGFSEILYAFSSASNNNGSAFAGISANTPFYNTALGIVHALRPLLAGHSGAGHCRRVRRREARPAVRRHAADAHAAVRVRADRHGDHRRRADVRAGAGARPGRRAPAHLRRPLTGSELSRNRHGNSGRQQDRAVVVRRAAKR